MKTKEAAETRFTVPPYEVSDVLHHLTTEMGHHRRGREPSARSRLAGRLRHVLFSAATRGKKTLRKIKRLFARRW